MTARIIIAIILFCLGTTGAIWGSLVMVAMMGEVNRKIPDGGRFSYIGFTLPKILEVLGAYRGSYPHGRMHLYYFAALGLTLFAFLGGAVLLWTWAGP
jgi:hypothetical protein